MNYLSLGGVRGGGVECKQDKDWIRVKEIKPRPGWYRSRNLDLQFKLKPVSSLYKHSLN